MVGLKATHTWLFCAFDMDHIVGIWCPVAVCARPTAFRTPSGALLYVVITRSHRWGKLIHMVAPLKEAVKYERITFNQGIFEQKTVYMGTPNEAQKNAWKDLTDRERHVNEMTSCFRLTYFRRCDQNG
jgi:hypothetical protein